MHPRFIIPLIWAFKVKSSHLVLNCPVSSLPKFMTFTVLVWDQVGFNAGVLKVWSRDLPKGHWGGAGRSLGKRETRKPCSKPDPGCSFLSETVWVTCRIWAAANKPLLQNLSPQNPELFACLFKVLGEARLSRTPNCRISCRQLWHHYFGPEFHTPPFNKPSKS